MTIHGRPILLQGEGAFEEEGLDADSRSPWSLGGGGGVRGGGPGDEGGFDDLGSLEHATSESMANAKDQESLAFFQVCTEERSKHHAHSLNLASKQTLPKHRRKVVASLCSLVGDGNALPTQGEFILRLAAG